jgi:hypothetical protein
METIEQKAKGLLVRGLDSLQYQNKCTTRRKISKTVETKLIVLLEQMPYSEAADFS